MIEINTNKHLKLVFANLLLAFSMLVVAQSPAGSYDKALDKSVTKKHYAAQSLSIASVDAKPVTSHYFSYNSNELIVSVNIDDGLIQYDIINISGQKVKSGNTEPFAPISVSNLYPGMYFIKYNSNQIKAIRKFIIQ